MKKKKPKLTTPAPVFSEDPRFSRGIDDLLSIGRRLSNFDLTGGLAPLQESISVNPETTRLFLQGLQAELAPIYRDVRNRTIAELAANNQLESSVTADRLLQADTDLERAMLSATTKFGLADINRALENRMRLEGMGLNALRMGTGYA